MSYGGPTRLYLDQAMRLCKLDPEDRKQRDAFRAELDAAGALMPKRRPKEDGRRRRRANPWTTVFHLHELKLLHFDPRLTMAVDERMRDVDERFEKIDERIDEIALGQKLVMELLGKIKAANDVQLRKRSTT